METKVETIANCKKASAARLRICPGSTLLLLALVLPFVLSGAFLVAQVASPTNSVTPAPRARRRANIDDRVKVLARNLDLNEAQQSAVKNILEQRQREMLQLRLDPTLTGDGRLNRFRAIQDNTVLRIRAILNEEQKKKYDPLAVRRRPSAPEQRSVEDWLNATTPK